jgi:predicted RecA/RadA family phage recombinase
MDVKNLQTVLQIKHVSTADYSTGDIVILGSLVSYVLNASTSGDLISLIVIGQGEVTKVESQAWTVGQKVYWDVSESEFTSTATGNLFAGIASDVAVSGASDITGRVLFNSTTLNDSGPTAANVVDLTDNSGGVDPADDIVAVVTNVDTLTDSTGGTADDIIAAIANDLDATMVPINGSGMTTAQEAEYDTMVAAVNVRLDKINENNKNFVDQIITQEAANIAITAAITQIIVKQSEIITALEDASLMATS